MSKVRGYSSYHGRGPLWKIVAAVLLAAVILASAGVLALERYIEKDSSGVSHIRLPWADAAADSGKTESPSGPAPENDSSGGKTNPSESDGTAENQEAVPEATPTPVRELLRMYGAYTAPFNWNTYGEESALAERYGYTAFAPLLKDSEGTLFFRAESAIPGTTRTERDTNEVLAFLGKEANLYSAARLTCFLDSRAANSNVRRYGLRNTGTYLFYDGNDANWLDPSKPDARSYLCALAREIAELGFDEIILTDAGYPTVGKLNKIDYGSTPIADNLTAFFSEMKETLASYPIRISVELPRAVFTHAENPSGLTAEIVLPYVNRVYCVVTPEEISYCDTTITQASGGNVEFVPILRILPAELPRQFLYLPEN